MLAASVMWGLMAPVSKAAMNSDAVSAMLVADVRIFGAAILFWILSLFTKGEKVQEKGDYIRFFFAGFFAIILNQGVYVTGVSMTSPVDASIITSSLVLFCATLGVGTISEIEIISSICMMLARGALISAVISMFIMPPVLCVCEPIFNKTSLHWRLPVKQVKEPMVSGK